MIKYLIFLLSISTTLSAQIMLPAYQGIQYKIPYDTTPVFCASAGSVATTVVDVSNPTTGKIWMDRNLGATQVATSSIDTKSYGDLYQWGRLSDGHQCRNSGTTSILSSSDVPENANFIKAPISLYNWRSSQNDNLWQGLSGVNNPCPTGYRIPTDSEWENERLSWVQAPVSSTNNATGAFASPLKLPKAGYREWKSGSIFILSPSGKYWSSNVNGNNSKLLIFTDNATSDAFVQTNYRSFGYSVRCIKN